MPPRLEEKLRNLENKQNDILKRLESISRYPIEYEAQKTLYRTLSRKFVEFLRPRDTDDANDGTFIAINNTPGIQFADAATKVTYFSFVPYQDLSILTMKFIWSTPATTGNLRWQIDFGEGGISDATNARTTGGTAISTAADGTANELSFTEIHIASGIDLRKLRQGNLWGIKFTRLGADAADTLTNTVNLYGILIEYKLY